MQLQIFTPSFVANEEYRKRVIQLGEPATVFNVGGMSIDAINSISIKKRN